MKNKRFLTIFTQLENIHLIKDVGMMPYILYKYCNYDSTIASYKNGEYPYIHTEVKGVRQVFIKRVFNWRFLDVFIFILLNFNKFDVIQFYHFSTNNFLWSISFKILTLGKGKTYLKLDSDDRIKALSFDSIKMKILKKIIDRIDLITIETTELSDYLSQKWARPVEYLPNGFYGTNRNDRVSFKEKENIILTVGRIGAKEKAVEVLCEAFRVFTEEAGKETWKLMLVGPVDEDFQHNYLKEFFERSPDLIDRVVITGGISDRRIIEKTYNKSKIFVLTSERESFGLVYLEAMRGGCYVVSTNLTSARDVTKNEKYGKLFSIGDHKQLAEILNFLHQNDKVIESNNDPVQDYVYSTYYWPNLCIKLDTLIFKN